MVEFEADDALAAGAQRWADADGVEQVVICTPDKDLRQCVRGTRVVCLDRRQRVIADETAVRAKYGIGPESIPDWLALVGDSADGYPGLPRWGEKSASAVLARYERLEDIPDDHRQWKVDVRGALSLADSIRTHRDDAMLFRTLATLRTDVPLRRRRRSPWRGGRRAELEALCDEIGEADIANACPLARALGAERDSARRPVDLALTASGPRKKSPTVFASRAGGVHRELGPPGARSARGGGARPEPRHRALEGFVAFRCRQEQHGDPSDRARFASNGRRSGRASAGATGDRRRQARPRRTLFIASIAAASTFTPRAGRCRGRRHDRRWRGPAQSAR